AVAACGGALILGALPRIAKRANARDSILLGLGIAILANSRPYEGLLFCIPAAAWFLWWLAGRTRSRDDLHKRIRRVLIPLLIVMVSAAVFMGYYNSRLTEHALLFPHVLNTRTYHTAPMFLWERPKPEISYRNEQFEDFYNGWERENYRRTRTDVLRVTKEKAVRCGLTYFWSGLLLALPAV